MWKLVFVSAFATCLLALCMANNFVCNGIWKVNNVEKCDNPEQYQFDVDVKKRKINRTHDGFTLISDLPEDITVDLGVHVDTYTKCDGGYKVSDTLDDNSLCALLNRFAKNEFERGLTMAGVDPPNCPIPKGLIEINDFVIDYNQLPKQAKCGEFKADIFMLKGQEKLSCLTLYTTFSPAEEDDD